MSRWCRKIVGKVKKDYVGKEKQGQWEMDILEARTSPWYRGRLPTL